MPSTRSAGQEADVPLKRVECVSQASCDVFSIHHYESMS